MRKRERLVLLYLTPWTILAAGWLLGGLSAENSELLGAWLLLVSAVLLGLPHGAYDFWILRNEVSQKRRLPLKLFLVLFLYSLLAIVVVVFWYFFPGFVLFGFLALTGWHFGSGDAVWENENKTDWLIQSIARGLIVISAPLVFHPAETRRVIARLDLNATEILLAIAPYTLAFALFILFTKTFVTLAGYSVHKNSNLLLTVTETCILLLFFWLTTPLLAVTIYLIGVHSWRHLLRSRVYEKGDVSTQPAPLWQFVGVFHLRTLPLTIISILGSVFIFWLLNLSFSDLSSYTTVYLVLLSALTLPHAALIGWKEFNLQNASVEMLT